MGNESAEPPAQSPKKQSSLVSVKPATITAPVAPQETMKIKDNTRYLPLVFNPKPTADHKGTITQLEPHLLFAFNMANQAIDYYFKLKVESPTFDPMVSKFLQSSSFAQDNITLADMTNILAGKHFRQMEKQKAVIMLGKEADEFLIDQDQTYLLLSKRSVGRGLALGQKVTQTGQYFIGLITTGGVPVEGILKHRGFRLKAKFANGLIQGPTQQIDQNSGVTIFSNFQQGVRKNCKLSYFKNNEQCIYGGQVENGCIQGKGVSFLGNCVQAGCFESGKLSKGCMLQEGDIYIGDFSQGKRSGFGAFYSHRTNQWVSGIFIEGKCSKSVRFFNNNQLGRKAKLKLQRLSAI